jgi:outer membrane protein
MTARARGRLARLVLVFIGFYCVESAAGARQPASAPPQLPLLRLPDAIQAALKQSPSIARALHLANAASEQIQEAEAGLMPSLAVQGAATNGPLGAPAFGPPGVQGLAADPLKKHYGAGLNVLLTLYDFGRTQHLVGARRALLEAARADTATQQAIVVLGVQVAYLNVLRDQQIVGVRAADVRRREATVQQARALVEAGLRAEVDLTQAQANLAESRVALAAAENEVQLAFAALNNAMGETRLTAYQLEAPPAPTATVQPAEPLMRQAVERRPELRRASEQLRSADQSIRAARSDLLPRLDSVASAGWLNPSSAITNNKPFAVGVLLTIPLYTGGAAEGRLAEERERRAAAEASRKEVEEAVKLQVARAWLAVQTRETQLQSAQAQAEAARSSLQQATERYRLQLSTFEELLAVEAAAIRADTQLVNDQFDLQQARAELDWASGETLRLVPPTPPVRRK